MANNPLPANIQKLMNAPASMQNLMNAPLGGAKQPLSGEPASTKTPTDLLNVPAGIQPPTRTPTEAQQLMNAPAGMHQATRTPAEAQQQQLMKSPAGMHLDLMNAPAGMHQPGRTPAASMQQLINAPGKLEQLTRTPASLQQRFRGDRLLFSSSDDNAMMKQIQETHAPDGRDVDVKPILHIVEDIFHRASPLITNGYTATVSPAHTETIEEKAYHLSSISLLEALAYIIERVSTEIAWKCSGVGDAHSTTMSILSTLSYYPWDAKLVIALAAFAMNYGEFWLIAQSYTSNQLAKSVAILKQLPDILEHSSSLKPRFDAINTLIKAMLDIAKCIVNIKELPPQYITSELTALSTAIAHVPLAVYWTIRSIVACASQITGLVGMGREQIASTAEAWELSSLAHKLNNMHSHLTGQLAVCHKHIDEKKFMESYQNLLHLFEMAHIDNMKVLKALINAKDDPLPLIDGETKRRVNMDVLRRKSVLLLISDLDIMPEELNILEQIYNESRKHPTWKETQYEVVWLPILDPSIPLAESRQKQFEELQADMTWYSVHHPSLVDRAVIKFIKEKWHFEKKPILVVLDPQGRVACPNALHMMWIWGTLAFPFTTLKEEALWKEETWRLELLVDAIDPVISNWMSEGRYICLYGGEDIEWIRKFTNSARAVAQAAGVPLGLAYVGKSNPRERVRRNISTILVENLSHCWQDTAMIWYFWVRIASMWHSKNQLGRTVENDPVLQEIMSMLTYDSSSGGWAILGRGTDDIIAKGKGATFLTCLLDYTIWKDDIPQKGFVLALKEYLKQLHTPHHCNKLVLPSTTGRIPERIVCSECGKTMERFLMYECCDE